MRDWIAFQLAWHQFLANHTLKRLADLSPNYWTESMGVTAFMNAIGVAGLKAVVAGALYAVLRASWSSNTDR